MNKGSITLNIFKNWTVDYILSSFDTETSKNEFLKKVKQIELYQEDVDEVNSNLDKGVENGAIVFNNKDIFKSLIFVYPHTSKAKRISSIVHECNHISLAITNHFGIDDEETQCHILEYLVKEIIEQSKLI
jgi:hypothetical protein